MKRRLKKYIFFLIAGLIFILGFVLQGIDLFLNPPLSDKKSLTSNEINSFYFQEGEYNLFYEYDTNKRDFGIVNFTRTIEINPDSLNIKIFAVEDQLEIVAKEDESMTFTDHTIQGKSLYSFNIEKSGMYNVELDDKNNVWNTEVQYSILANFKGIILSGFKRIGIHVLVSIPFLLIGLYMYLRDRRNKTLIT
ncbi:hypothetical protein [Paenibacillus camelliae]|uniref:hypothetical protein n=1 Tax=Paenibacillus camelliae TaxID=512410 RepID=UPI002040451E|nr:hypothetical protein [Paenibacillus camelliae]MCM3633545.1 hypothetical protein [Paenibacillus camelliae]